MSKLKITLPEPSLRYSFRFFLPDLLVIIVYSKIPVQLFLPSFGKPFVYTSASQIHRLNHAGFNLAASVQFDAIFDFLCVLACLRFLASRD